jgi:HEAT repeat protein
VNTDGWSSFSWRTLVIVGVLSALSAAQLPKERAWDILKSGAADKSAAKRTAAVRALALLPNDPIAVHLAENALTDDRPEVRAAAAFSLGEMNAKGSLPKLRDALKDPDTKVVLAVAAALKTLGDNQGYDVYYGVLTGERKTGNGLLEDQKKMLHDPKKLAEFGLEQGIGFIPYAGYGWEAVRLLMKDDASPVRAAAAKALAVDPDQRSAQALTDAAFDDSWMVRAAALEAIARRDDPALLDRIIPELDDDKDIVRYTAAATVVRLSSHPTRTAKMKKQKLTAQK